MLAHSSVAGNQLLTSAWGPKVSQGVFSFLPYRTPKVEGVIQADLGVSQKTAF